MTEQTTFAYNIEHFKHTALYWTCLYFHSFKVLRILYIPSVCLSSLQQFYVQSQQYKRYKNS